MPTNLISSASDSAVRASGRARNRAAPGFIDRAEMDLNVVMSMGDTGVVEWCLEDVKQVISEYQKALQQDFPATTRATLERQLSENQATLTGLEKILKPYGHPRS